ncbi:hypothetical protein B0H13DRAFT_1889987 [Mycena leptocephala]|nr:hypothetical protein B0H13DRAFT_1889987 [Mycena leptocephala]
MGVFEGDTRGVCVSKIVTETREEKEEKALRARWEDGREWKPGKSQERGGEYEHTPLFTPAERGARCGSHATQAKPAPGGIHAHRTANLSAGGGGGNKNERARADSAPFSSSALPASHPPHDAMLPHPRVENGPKKKRRERTLPAPLPIPHTTPNAFMPHGGQGGAGWEWEEERVWVYWDKPPAAGAVSRMYPTQELGEIPQIKAHHPAPNRARVVADSGR